MGMVLVQWLMMNGMMPCPPNDPGSNLGDAFSRSSSRSLLGRCSGVACLKTQKRLDL
jgi:hypothetical protein